MEGVEESLQGDWTHGERVCLAFLKHIRATAVQSRIHVGDRTNEVISFGKLGMTCRRFRNIVRDPIVANMFAYEVEMMYMDLEVRLYPRQ